MMKLGSDSAVEAFAHYCTEPEIREYLENLTERDRNRLVTHGHIAISRSLESNKESAGVVCALLDQPEIEVNLPQVGQDGNTLLRTAVLLRDKEVVRMLLARADLDPNVGNVRTEDTPVHLAAQPGASPEILDLLVSDPRVNIAALNKDKQSALHVACKRNNWSSPSKDSSQVEVVRRLMASAAATVKSAPQFLKNQDRFGRNALAYVAESGLDDIIGEILAHAVICSTPQISSDVSNYDHLALSQDNKGCQAVHLAAQECLRAECSLTKLLCSVVHLYLELLTLTTHHHIDEEKSSTGDLPGSKFRFGSTLIPVRITFFLSMVSTILAAFAALPFWVGFPPLCEKVVLPDEGADCAGVVLSHVVSWSDYVCAHTLPARLSARSVPVCGGLRDSPGDVHVSVPGVLGDECC